MTTTTSHRAPARSVTALAALALAGALAGCNVGPDYAAPVRPTPASFAEVGEGGVRSAPADEAALQQWWRTFGDPTLDSLVDRAVASNLDLRIAEARLREARALRAVAASELLPAVDGVGSYQRQRSSESITRGGNFGPGGPGSTTNLFQLGFDASWEIDVWGRVRRSVEAADADLGAAVEETRDVLVTVLAEVARNYVELRAFQRRLELNNQNIELQRDSLALARSRFEAGITSELDVQQAEAQLASTTAQGPALDSLARQSAHRIGVLLGQDPGSLLGELRPLAPIPLTVNGAPVDLPVGVPSDLLRRRPDIRRAERQLAGATARIGVATADFFPRFTLTGGFGLESIDADSLFNAGSRYWTIGPSMRWPILDWGRIRGNINVAEARTEQALASWERSVLAAMEEAENALIAYIREQTRRTSLARAVEANQRSLDLSKELYTKGLATFLNVLDAQRSLLVSQDLLAQSDQTVASSLVAIYKALGGGWVDPALASSSTAEPQTEQAAPEGGASRGPEAPSAG